MNSIKSHFYQPTRSVPKKFLASLVILTFFFSQTIPSGFADITLRPERAVPYQPETNAVDDSSNPQQTEPAPKVPIDPSAAFLQDQLHLEPSATPKTQQQVTPQNARDYAEYSFEDAVAQFSPDYASAVVVESLTAENLRQLNSLDIEVGIAVVRGKIVMFTTGSRDELRANPVVQSILAESPILIHTHPQGTQTMPSALDISLAGLTTEYVLSGSGVYAYNSTGIISSDLSEEDLVALIETDHVPEASSVEARAILNEFIAEIDQYNSDPAQYTVFRSAQPITVLPGKPTLGSWASSTPPAPNPTVTQLSSSEFTVAYDVSNSGSYSGVTVNLATNGQTSQDLSGLGYFSFDVKSTVACSTSGSDRCLKLELKDTANNVAAFAITSLSTTYSNISVSACSFLI